MNDDNKTGLDRILADLNQINDEGIETITMFPFWGLTVFLIYLGLPDVGVIKCIPETIQIIHPDPVQEPFDFPLLKGIMVGLLGWMALAWWLMPKRLGELYTPKDEAQAVVLWVYGGVICIPLALCCIVWLLGYSALWLIPAFILSLVALVYSGWPWLSEELILGYE